MIVKIKKHTFLVYHRDYDDFLKSLRDAGIVHVVEKRKLDENSIIGDDLKLLARYRKAIKELSELNLEPLPSSDYHTDPETALEGFESSLKEIEEVRARMSLLKPESERIKLWGEFDPDSMKKLKESGWNLSLFTSSEKGFKNTWRENYDIEILGRTRGKVYFVVIHKDDTIPEIDADYEKFPDKPYGLLLEEISSYQKQIDEIESGINKMAPEWLGIMKNAHDRLFSRIEYSETAEQADKFAENNLYVLEGWIPVADEKRVEDELKKTDYYTFVSDPDPKDKIPVILKNNNFVKLFEPITRLFSLPDYRELDLTPFFAPFFMLFFGFCLGDAGYGLSFILIGFLIKRKVKAELRPIITLAQYFGIAAVFFGLLSGTFFGINLIDSGYTITERSVLRMEELGIPDRELSQISMIKGETFRTRQSFTDEIIILTGEDFYNQNKNIILRSAESKFSILNNFRHLMQDPSSMFNLALLIGAVQILFGMILKIINISRQKGFKYSLSTVGWVILALTFIIFKGGSKIGLIDEMSLKPVFNGLLIFSGILILLLNTPGANIFLRIGSGIWDTYSVLTGVLGDLLSYIRLFALGMSSSILGFVFNDISVQMLSVPYVGWLIFLIILLFGHTINIFMATLGSFVHPMRLTFVEFYKNAGFSGGGIDYKPFKNKIVNNKTE